MTETADQKVPVPSDAGRVACFVATVTIQFKNILGANFTGWQVALENVSLKADVDGISYLLVFDDGSRATLTLTAESSHAVPLVLVANNYDLSTADIYAIKGYVAENKTNSPATSRPPQRQHVG